MQEPVALESDVLGPLPEAMTDYPEAGEKTYTEAALLAFGRQERAAERERCAKPVQEPFALPCPTPKACKAHCCSGNCIPRSKA